jgi:hypothetical protein
MIPLEDVRKQLGNEEAKEQPSRSEKGDESGETIPPGVEREGVSFNNNPCFLPEGGVETGGESFNSQSPRKDLVFSEQPRPLIEEVVPALPQSAPLVRRRGVKVLSEKLIEDFCLLLSLGLSRRQAAARLGIDHSTISHAADKDEGIAELLRRAEEMAAGEPMLCLIAASRKNWRAALSLLKHRRECPAKPDLDEKMRRYAEKLEDTRLECQYQRHVAEINDAQEEYWRQRKQAKKDAKEAAWQEREKEMLKKEREEREARRKRRAEREAAGNVAK